MKPSLTLLLFCFSITILFNTVNAHAEEGIVNLTSNSSVEITANKLERLLKVRGITLFDRISHSNGASAVGLQLEETELLIFGSPKLGTPLIKCAPNVGLELPLRVLIRKNDSGVVISYSSPEYLKQRFQIKGCDAELEKMSSLLKGITEGISK